MLASKIAPDFTPKEFSVPYLASERFLWLAEPFTMDEFEAALCKVMVERELPIHIIRLLWNLLKKKKLVFYVDGVDYMPRTGYKGLPQGSVLSPFLYSLLGSGVDRFI
jgi:hypothetical protein